MVAGGGYNWVQTIISIYDAGNLGLAALEPLHHKLRGEVYIDKKKIWEKRMGHYFNFFLSMLRD